MRNWRVKINIKQHLTNEGTPEAAVRAARAIAPMLARWPKDGDWLDDVEAIACDFRDIPADDQTLGDVNNGLDRLYDCADWDRVWLGP